MAFVALLGFFLLMCDIASRSVFKRGLSDRLLEGEFPLPERVGAGIRAGGFEPRVVPCPHNLPVGWGELQNIEEVTNWFGGSRFRGQLECATYMYQTTFRGKLYFPIAACPIPGQNSRALFDFVQERCGGNEQFASMLPQDVVRSTQVMGAPVLVQERDIMRSIGITGTRSLYFSPTFAVDPRPRENWDLPPVGRLWVAWRQPGPGGDLMFSQVSKRLTGDNSIRAFEMVRGRIDRSTLYAERRLILFGDTGPPEWSGYMRISAYRPPYLGDRLPDMYRRSDIMLSIGKSPYGRTDIEVSPINAMTGPYQAGDIPLHKLWTPLDYLGPDEEIIFAEMSTVLLGERPPYSRALSTLAETGWTNSPDHRVRINAFTDGGPVELQRFIRIAQEVPQLENQGTVFRRADGSRLVMRRINILKSIDLGGGEDRMSISISERFALSPVAERRFGRPGELWLAIRPRDMGAGELIFAKALPHVVSPGFIPDDLNVVNFTRRIPDRNATLVAFSSASGSDRYLRVSVVPGVGETGLEEVVQEYEDPCTICLNMVDPGPDTPLHCGHVFHEGCLTQWLAQPVGMRGCPMCRAPV